MARQIGAFGSGHYDTGFGRLVASPRPIRRHARWVAEWDAAIDAATGDEAKLLAVFDALESFRRRPDGARWCAFLGASAEYADPPTELAEAIHRDTTLLRTRLHDLATHVPCADPAALADQLLLLVSGELAMRLREPDHPAGQGRRIATALIGSGRAVSPG